MRRSWIWPACAAVVLLVASRLHPQGTAPGGIAVVGGKVFSMAGEPLTEGVVLVSEGRIEAVGPADGISVPAGYRVVDAAGCVVTPGFIELHNHTGASDLQSNVYQVNPGMRVLDNLEFDNQAMRVAAAGGVTCVLTIPGSSSNMGGWGVIRKTHGQNTDDVVVRFPGALKIAQAGNPERYGGDLGYSRMGMNWLIRNIIREGKRYHEAWLAYERGEVEEQPPKIIRYEYLRGLFRGDYPIAVHTQMMAVVQATMRILADEMGVRVIVDHGTFDGFKNAPEISERSIPVANGPRQFWFNRDQARFVGLAAAWYWTGVEDVCVNTDAPVVAQEELTYQAAWAIRMGLPEQAALEGLTVKAARMLGIQDRVGTLEEGKDADLVVWTGDPFDPRHRTRVVLVNGEVAYDAERDGILY